MMEAKTGKKTGRMPAYVIYAFLWIFFLIIPVITNNYWAGGDFARITYDWLRMSPFFLVFLMNNFLLLPHILFMGYTKYYLFTLLLTVGIITGIFQIIGPELYKNDPELIEQRMLQDPQWGRQDMMPGSPAAQVPGSTEIFKAAEEDSRIPSPYPPFFQSLNTFLISLFVAGFNTAIAMTNKWVSEEQARKEAEKEHIRSELAFLQNQVSPHFFMNTLNNIHSLIDGDQRLAQNAVLKLSAMMRYLLYESGRGTTTLKKEIEFLKSYVNLMQLRVDEKVKVDLDLPEIVNDVSLPPLLFISFIENAFKHGVSYRDNSYLSFRLTRNPGNIEFTSVNTVSAFGGTNTSKDHGIGLVNIHKRLDLLYKGNYKLDISRTENEFKVMLVIPVQT